MSETRARYDTRPSFHVELHLNPRGKVQPSLRSFTCQAATAEEAGCRASECLRRTVRESGKGWIGVYRILVRDAETMRPLLDIPEGFRL